MNWFSLAIGTAAASGVGLVAWAIRAAGQPAGGGGKMIPGDATMTGGRATPRQSVYIESGVMHGPGGLTYRLTDTDLLWLGRAMLGEAGTIPGRQAVAWAMATNFMAYRGPAYSSGGQQVRRPRMGPSFRRLLQAYCQPINPKWARGGPGCRSNPEACTERHLQRRERITNTSYAALPGDIKTILTQFRAGSLPNPVPGLTDWHANRWSGSKVPIVNVGDNWFGIRDYMRA